MQKKAQVISTQEEKGFNRFGGRGNRYVTYIAETAFPISDSIPQANQKQQSIQSAGVTARALFFRFNQETFVMRLREFPDPEKRPGGPGAKYRKHDRKAEEEKKQREREGPSKKEVSNEEPAGETIRPITNRDEEKIITNTDKSGYPLTDDEREGV